MPPTEDLDGEFVLPGFERTPQEVAKVLAAPATGGELAARFGVPPFSILDARAGYWQTRKRAWLALGIQSEVGRGENLLKMSDTVLEPDPEKRAAAKAATAEAAAKGYAGNPHLEAGAQRALGAYFTKGGTTGRGGKPLTYNTDNDDPVSQQIGKVAAGGTSVFDPVLVELYTRWFSGPGFKILDPFAGGSVRGIVAAKLGRDYTGIDLSAGQIAANEAQRAALLDPAEQARVRWVHGDSRECARLAPGAYDCIASCPPYAFLERYSDDPRDLSTLVYEEFVHSYSAIIKAAAGMLKDNRFAIFTVGDVRSRKGGGAYLNFPGDTIAAFRAAGLDLYNYAILVTSVGSLSIRVSGSFPKSRKLGHAHQDVIIFVKGDPFEAARACGPLAEFAVEEADAPTQVAVPAAPDDEQDIAAMAGGATSDPDDAPATGPQLMPPLPPPIADQFVQPTINCPECGREYPDFDGVGVTYCSCGFCRHTARIVRNGASECETCGEVRAE